MAVLGYAYGYAVFMASLMAMLLFSYANGYYGYAMFMTM